MARPRIDDDEVMLALGTAFARRPQQKFAEAYRTVIACFDESLPGNSPDSTRRRVQRKFNARREWFLAQGHQQIREKRARSVTSFVEANRRSAEAFARIRSQFPKQGEVARLSSFFQPLPKSDFLIAIERMQQLTEPSRRLAMALNDATSPIRQQMDSMERLRNAIRCMSDPLDFSNVG